MTATADGCAVLRLIGEVDAATLLGFRGQADELLLDDSVDRLIVDLDGATRLDDSVLGLLLHLKMLTVDNAIDLAVRAVGPAARSLLTLSGLDRVLTILE